MGSQKAPLLSELSELNSGPKLDHQQRVPQFLPDPIERVPKEGKGIQETCMCTGTYGIRLASVTDKRYIYAIGTSIAIITQEQHPPLSCLFLCSLEYGQKSHAQPKGLRMKR